MQECSNKQNTSLSLLLGPNLNTAMLQPIDPAHGREKLTEPSLEGVQRRLEGVAVLLAQRMEVQPLQAVEILRLQVRGPGAERFGGGVGLGPWSRSRHRIA